jgi:hypothetical protein
VYQGDCKNCGRKVGSDENYLEARLWTSTAIFHWSCFVVLMKAHRETTAEHAICKAKRANRVSKANAASPVSG